jgi:HEPN domain-containing protein
MPFDPVLLLDTKAWFRKVAIDLRSAEADLVATPPILEDVVFHCQQAAEKAIKGFLTYHQQPFGKTHDIRELGKACAPCEPTLAALLERAMPLTWYAWRFRYPGSPDEPTLDETREALAIARELVAALLSRLPEEVGP